MANCPTCGEPLEYVDTELIDLRGYEETVEMKSGDASEGQAVATVCPSCDALLSL
ncbi:MAG: hypothetical protein ABEI96_00735 [Haloarculaceae archaeon]